MVKAGETFGILTVIKDQERLPGSYIYVAACRCECGNIKNVRCNHLNNGHTRSCGCLVAKTAKKHGEHSSREYVAWNHMVNRCHNPSDRKYGDYGARGIVVCERWRNSVSNFIEDMGRKPTAKHSIERVDNSGNYEPGNCKWATANEQAINTRRNIFWTHNGITLCIAEWSRKLGVKYAALYHRFRKGKSGEQVIAEFIK